MDLDDCMITTFCLVDEVISQVLEGQRLRQRGPAPTLADREVLTMELVGE
jgi:DDE family transposase